MRLDSTQLVTMLQSVVLMVVQSWRRFKDWCSSTALWESGHYHMTIRYNGLSVDGLKIDTDASSDGAGGAAGEYFGYGVSYDMGMANVCIC